MQIYIIGINLRVMIKLLFVLLFIIIIFFILFKKNQNNNNKRSNFFKNLILIVIVLGVLFFLATYGRFLIPQILQIFKLAIPLLTKFIGI